MPVGHFSKGARIQNWNALAAAIEQDGYVFIGDYLTPIQTVQQMTFLGIQRLLLQGDLYVANAKL